VLFPGGGSMNLPNNILKLNNEAQYKELIAVLDQLIDEVGNDENHPLASPMELIGTLIEQYEDEHVPELDGTKDSEPSV
jgi:HTH-type transcriptional regulator/antitoxin HigA